MTSGHFSDNPFLHFRPRKISAPALRLRHTWALGGSAFVLLLLLFFSGLLLRLRYDPFPGLAYESIVALQQEVLFGRFVRNLHHWSANLLVVVSFLHLLRVFYTGGFHRPRQFNWLLGWLLGLGCLAAAFTGYLLPWDQLAYWAITIGLGLLDYLPVVGAALQQTMRGDSEIGAVTLKNFYALHTTILPAALTVLLGLHFWYTRRLGGVLVDRVPDENRASSADMLLPGSELLRREGIAGLVVLALVFLAAAWFDAPLAGKANPSLSPDPVKAPWYFAGFQELLLLLPPISAIWILPPLLIVGWISLAWLKIDPPPTGRWFYSPKGRRLAAISALLALVLTPFGIVWLDRLNVGKPAVDGFLTATGPWLIIVGTGLGYGLGLKKWARASRFEVLQALLTMALVVFGMLTLSGVFFRGQGMTLRAF